ncbi:hypothetical protein [Micromonospora phytophila]|nr:hypothetical protein [Micromonospora phytophila]
MSELHVYYPAGGRTTAGCDRAYRRVAGRPGGSGGWDSFAGI